MSLKQKPNLYESMGIAGTTAVISVNFTHPLDLFKTRLQADKFNFSQLIKEEGIFSFFERYKSCLFARSNLYKYQVGLLWTH